MPEIWQCITSRAAHTHAALTCRVVAPRGCDRHCPPTGLEICALARRGAAEALQGTGGAPGRGSVASVTAVMLPEGAAAGAATLAAVTRPPEPASGTELPPEAVRLPVPSLLLLSLESSSSIVSCAPAVSPVGVARGPLRTQRPRGN